MTRVCYNKQCPHWNYKNGLCNFKDPDKSCHYKHITEALTKAEQEIKQDNLFGGQDAEMSK